METYDVILIGAGHNALVCAAYLLKAGYSVLLLERREFPGGACTTEELLPQTAPGFKFNPCAIDHLFIHLGPVVQELELQKYGLEYLLCDPVVFCPHPDGKYFLGHKSVEKTCAEIARYSPRDAEKYAEYVDFWQRVIALLTPMFNAPPQSIVDIAGNFDLDQIQKSLSLVGGTKKTLDLFHTMFSSARDQIDELFDSEFLKAPLNRLSAELSTPPSQKNTAIGAMMMTMRHHPGMARPKGGTGALVDALVRLVQAKGGKILTEQAVDRVLVDHNRAVGVRTQNGKEYRATKGVISSLDAKRLFLRHIAPSDVDRADPQLRERVDRRIVMHNEAILKIDVALSELPRFENHNHHDEFLTGSILIADSVNQVEVAHSDPAVGKIPLEDPSMYMAIPSVRDPSLAPEGKHTLWIEYFVPYQIAGAEGTGIEGTGWTDELKGRVADRVLDKLADYAPNLKHSVIDRHIESPPELTQRIGVLRGNYYHLDMTFEQMIFFRPLPELANYTTPIEGLYLTGAGTHPGGSISGMPGRNAARVFLQSQRSIGESIGHTLNQAGESIREMVYSLFK